MSYQDQNPGYYQGGGPPQQGQYGQYKEYGQAPPQEQYQQQRGSYQGQQGFQQQQGLSGGNAAMHSTDSGQFPGGDYRIIHRDTNSVLSINLSEGGTIKSRTGAMIEMGGRINLEGTGKFSMKKLFTGGTIYENTYTGSGLVTLAPVMLGDVQTLRIDGSANWRVGKHGYLAATEGVIKEVKSQGVGKGLLSGGTIYVYNVSGNGLMWVSSFGAIIQREIPAGETHVVDHSHLVAWNCEYNIETVGKGFLSTVKSGEGLICRFTGPGVVYLQTRNLEDFSDMVAEIAHCQRN